MTDEPTFTLAEARAELARRECVAHGHRWDVVEEFGVGPVHIVCYTCGKTLNIADMPDADATQEDRDGAIAALRRLTDTMEADPDMRVRATITATRDHFTRADAELTATARTAVTTVSIDV